MKTRITLTLDPQVHERAKVTARRRHTTFSGLVEALLVQADGAKGRSLVDEMVGASRLRESPTGKDPLYDALHERHIKRRG